MYALPPPPHPTSAHDSSKTCRAMFQPMAHDDCDDDGDAGDDDGGDDVASAQCHGSITVLLPLCSINNEPWLESIRLLRPILNNRGQLICHGR